MVSIDREASGQERPNGVFGLAPALKSLPRAAPADGSGSFLHARGPSRGTVTKADTLGEVVTITSDPIRVPFSIKSTATVTKADTLGEVVTITNDPIRDEASLIIVAEGPEPAPGLGPNASRGPGTRVVTAPA